MKLTDEQGNKIKVLVADDEVANKVLEALKTTKGKVKLFGDDGEIVLTKEELLKKTINKPAKKAVAKKAPVQTPAMNPKKMGYLEIEEQMKVFAKELKAKRNERLAEINASIAKLQAEKQKIEADIQAEEAEQAQN